WHTLVVMPQLLLLVAVGWALALVGCSKGPSASGQPPAPAPTVAPSSHEGLETAVLAGGCFWGMEEILRAIPGVVDTEVGYAGGKTADPSYDDVKTGRTGHA